MPCGKSSFEKAKANGEWEWVQQKLIWKERSSTADSGYTAVGLSKQPLEVNYLHLNKIILC